MNKTEEMLKKVGLTTVESKAYIALLELQEAQTGTLCKRTKITSSNIYAILDSLIKKGLVNYRVQNNIKVFMPSSPDTLNELFKEKQKQLDEERVEILDVVENLKKLEPEKLPFSNYKYFEGTTGIKSLWHEINKAMTSKDIVRIHTGKREGYERFLAFYTEHHKLRVKKKVHERLLYPLDERDLAKSRLKLGFTEIRELDLKNVGQWGVANNMFFIYYITGKVPRGFIIIDEIFATLFKQVFDQIWAQAKEVK